MPILKTKKEKQSFRDNILHILESNGVIVERENEDRLISQLQSLYETWRPDTRTPHWDKLVGQYFSCFEAIHRKKPAFVGADPKALKDLSKLLKNKYAESNPTSLWSEIVALNKHLEFYRTAAKIDFYKKNFYVSTLYNNYDKIIIQSTHS